MILNAVFWYSVDCAMTCDVDCVSTSRHMDGNQEKLEPNMGFLRQMNFHLGCIVAISAACA